MENIIPPSEKLAFPLLNLLKCGWLPKKDRFQRDWFFHSAPLAISEGWRKIPEWTRINEFDFRDKLTANAFVMT